MIYLMNALPNSILIPKQVAAARTIVRWSEEVATRCLEEGFVSAIGHESTAGAIALRTGLDVEANRVALVWKLTGRRDEVLLHPGDCLIVAAVQTPRRLPEGELYTEEEIVQMPIVWAFVQL